MNLRREIIGGITTFTSMPYIVVMIPRFSCSAK